MLEQNYIVGAKVRGLPYRRILFRHALRNAAGPALVVLGNDFPQMLAGAVAAEAVFSLPGLGQLLLESAQTRDIPVVQGLLLVDQHLRHRGQPGGQHHAELAVPDRRRDGHMSGRGRLTGRNGSGSVLRLPSARIAIGVLTVIAILTAFGSALAPQNPLAINANALFQGPSAHHLLGTDYLGRDVLSRLHGRDPPVGAHRASRRSGSGWCSARSPASPPCSSGRWFDFAANRVSDALMTLPVHLLRRRGHRRARQRPGRRR